MAETKRRGIELTEEQWRHAKVEAARRGVTLSEWFGALVDDANKLKLPMEVKPEPTPDMGIHKRIGDHPLPDTRSFNSRPFTPVPKKAK